MSVEPQNPLFYVGAWVTEQTETGGPGVPLSSLLHTQASVCSVGPSGDMAKCSRVSEAVGSALHSAGLYDKFHPSRKATTVPAASKAQVDRALQVLEASEF